ncbi:MAG: hypothetical protein AB8B77_07870 [Alphaproteobacteria bacterium]
MIYRFKNHMLCALLLLGLSISTLTHAQAQEIDEAEYLRLEVISKTLYSRSKENPNWEKLMIPQWSAFRDAMNVFIMNSVEGRDTKAIPPAGYLSAKIDWDSLGTGGNPVAFDRVPDAWFNLQAEKIRTAMQEADILLKTPDFEAEPVTEQFKIIKNAVLAWPRPPLSKRN